MNQDWLIDPLNVEVHTYLWNRAVRTHSIMSAESMTVTIRSLRSEWGAVQSDQRWGKTSFPARTADTRAPYLVSQPICSGLDKGCSQVTFLNDLSPVSCLLSLGLSSFFFVFLLEPTSSLFHSLSLSVYFLHCESAYRSLPIRGCHTRPTRTSHL